MHVDETLRNSNHSVSPVSLVTHGRRVLEEACIPEVDLSHNSSSTGGIYLVDDVVASKIMVVIVGRKME